MAALLCLGFGSGLPLFLTSKTLQAWMTVAGVDLSTIGLFSLVAVPYSLKFLWAPVIDRFVPPFLGRRRGWLWVMQLSLSLAIALMALQNPHQALQLLALNALLIAFLSATQDIAFDAYRTDVLERSELGAGAAVGVLGYRLALLVTGSLALILADHLAWPLVYLGLAGLMIIASTATLWLAPEPIRQEVPPKSLRDAVVLPLSEFFERLGCQRGVLILIFIAIYKLGDSLVKNMATPFLLAGTGLGFSQTEIGEIQGGLGLVATIVGSLVGGAVIAKIGVNRSLWLFGGLQAVSNLSYVALALAGKNYPLLLAATTTENFCAGLEAAAFVAFLMSLCNQRFSATQYALLSSLMAFSRDILIAPAGGIALAVGWPVFFLLTGLASLPGLLLLPFFAPWQSDEVVS